MVKISEKKKSRSDKRKKQSMILQKCMVRLSIFLLAPYHGRLVSVIQLRLRSITGKYLIDSRKKRIPVSLVFIPFL